MAAGGRGKKTLACADTPGWAMLIKGHVITSHVSCLLLCGIHSTADEEPRISARPSIGHCPGISAQAIFRGSGSQSQDSWAKQGWNLCAGEIHPGSFTEMMQLQRFFEDSHFCILSILREERFTAFSIDIFKSAVCPQGKPRTEQFQFISHKDENNRRVTLR